MTRADEDIIVKMSGIPGPSVVVPHGADDEAVRQAARLCAAYSKAKEGDTVDVAVLNRGSKEILRTSVPDKEEFYSAIL